MNPILCREVYNGSAYVSGMDPLQFILGEINVPAGNMATGNTCLGWN